MSELEQIQQKAAAEKLEFLVIGGLAVIEHGFARLTTDIDLLVRSAAGEDWKRILLAMGYSLLNEKSGFQQYERPEVKGWPLDLMLVNNSSYEQLALASLATDIMGASVRMVS